MPRRRLLPSRRANDGTPQWYLGTAGPRRRTLSRRGVRAPLSKATFLADLGAARATLREALARSDERTLATARVPGLDWTAKDVLAHLIGYDHAVIAALQGIRAGRPLQWPWTDFDSWNASSVAPRRERPFVAVVTELETSRAALLRELAGWPEDAGPFGADSWDRHKSPIEWIAPHEREHATMIAKLEAG